MIAFYTTNILYIETDCFHSSCSIITDIMKVQMQSNSVNCGIYAIAFLTDLCYGKDPASCRYASTEVHNHLVTCFENGHMTPFPEGFDETS